MAYYASTADLEAHQVQEIPQHLQNKSNSCYFSIDIL